MEASRSESGTSERSVSIERAAELLRHGGLVAFPTETVYGLGADACNDEAVARVFSAKGRPRFDPLIVHFANTDDALAFGAGGDAMRERLAEALWPGPLTMLVRKHPTLSYLTTNGAEVVAIRVPDHPIAQRLIAMAKVPVAAPSANRFGHVSPTTAQHVADDLGNDVDAILDGGACTLGVESTVVEVDRTGLVVHRLGGVAIERLAEYGPVRLANPDAERYSPGRLKSHYAPDAALRVFAHGETIPQRDEGEGLVLFSPRKEAETFDGDALVLSPNGSVEGAAARLFAVLREAELKWTKVCIEGAPDEGIGRAINDRLRRASGSRDVAN